MILLELIIQLFEGLEVFDCDAHLFNFLERIKRWHDSGMHILDLPRPTLGCAPSIGRASLPHPRHRLTAVSGLRFEFPHWTV